MQPPPFGREDDRFEEAKGWTCPHCGQVGQLNRHGGLRGLSVDGTRKDGGRGQRFFCSNRGRRRGCGRTIAVRWASVLKGASVRTGTFWRFVVARLNGQSVARAWEAAGGRFSLEAAYGWWRRWRRAEPRVRTLLAQGRDPPAADLGTLLAAAYGMSDPVAGFQWVEQRGWP